MIPIGLDRLRSRDAALSEARGGGGGYMDEVSRRLGLVESAVAELRGDVRHLATKADLKAEVGVLSTQIASLEGRIIKWLGATLIASIGAAAGVVKLLI